MRGAARLEARAGGGHMKSEKEVREYVEAFLKKKCGDVPMDTEFGDCDPPRGVKIRIDWATRLSAKLGCNPSVKAVKDADTLGKFVQMMVDSRTDTAGLLTKMSRRFAAENDTDGLFRA